MPLPLRPRGESSLRTTVISSTGSWDWPPVRLPAKKSPSNMSRAVLELRASTRVAPTVTKSPIWLVTRPPMSPVELVSRSGSRSTPCPGSLMREAMRVAAYLSEVKSNCTPLKVGFENVIGVSPGADAVACGEGVGVLPPGIAADRHRAEPGLELVPLEDGASRPLRLILSPVVDQPPVTDVVAEEIVEEIPFEVGVDVAHVGRRAVVGMLPLPPLELAVELLRHVPALNGRGQGVEMNPRGGR